MLIKTFQKWTDLMLTIPIIKYRYKRFGKWYEGERIGTKESIEKYEMVGIVVINDSEEDEFI